MAQAGYRVTAVGENLLAPTWKERNLLLRRGRAFFSVAVGIRESLRMGSSDEAYDKIASAITGDLRSFLNDSWKTKPHVARGACLSSFPYGVDEFLADLVAVQPPPYVSVSVGAQGRDVSYHSSADSLRAAVQSGSVCYIKISRFWTSEHIPDAWKAMRHLYSALFRKVSMMHISSGASENVDLFLSGPESTLGAHFDDADVFSVQITGERIWQVDSHSSFEELELLHDQNVLSRNLETPFQFQPYEYRLNPGDTLYVPAYAVHKAIGSGTWSVSLSLGLNTFNEFDLVERAIKEQRGQLFRSRKPFHSLPADSGALHRAAQEELLARSDRLLDELKSRVHAYVAQDLQLPPHLESVSRCDAERRFTTRIHSGVGSFVYDQHTSG